MITRVCASDGRYYYLEDTPFKEGGEAYVYRVQGNASLLAKVYKQPRPERAAKLRFMLEHPPKNPTAAKNHQAYAWPTALISSVKSSAMVGFLMPFVANMHELCAFYNPKARRQTCPQFNYRYLMQTARNIAGVMSELHSKEYVIGDINQKNILVSDTAMVTVLDTDSFQFRDPQSGYLHLCRVSTPGFTPPEGYTKSKKDVERNVEEDLFGLGVLIFHLLMEGFHPFQCKYTGPGEPPNFDQNVKAGRFAHGRQDKLFQPMPTAPPFDMVNAELRGLFTRCFVDGHDRPAARPKAQEWQRALSKAAKDLVVCTRNENHYYNGHLGRDCPWCARVEKRLPDSFPMLTNARPALREATKPQPSRGDEVVDVQKPPTRSKFQRALLLLLGLTIFLIMWLAATGNL